MSRALEMGGTPHSRGILRDREDRAIMMEEPVERPICHDFLRGGACTRPLCRFAHPVARRSVGPASDGRSSTDAGGAGSHTGIVPSTRSAHEPVWFPEPESRKPVVVRVANELGIVFYGILIIRGFIIVVRGKGCV